jgi:hypothetical protein
VSAALSFVIINEGTSKSPLASQVTAAWLTRCAAACTVQLNRDVAPEWGGAYRVRAGASVTDIAAGEIVFALVDELAAAPGDVAYHDVDGKDAPVAFLALTTCSTLDDVSTAISHELCETAGDPACNLWVDDGKGSEWARELCDAVESTSYPVDLNDGQPPILVSDFLLQAFFGPFAPAPYSFRAAPVLPFQTAAGGYQIKRAAGLGETQVQAHSASRRGLKVLGGAHHWSSRPARRGMAPKA